MVGAGAVGLEAAIDMQREGKDVTVIELMDDYVSLRQSGNAGAAEFLRLIDAIGLDVRLSHKLLEITPTDVLCENGKTGEQLRLPADTVLLAVGLRSRWEEANELRQACEGTFGFLIGDCLYAGGNVKAATSGALSAAGYL